MKIFISWSGPHAMAIAKVLKAWLKNTFDSAEPWYSDEDISGGQVSLAEIARALAGAKFGIVVTTKTNQDAPWLSYEAGAMSREVDGGETRVMPMLVDLRVADLTSPLKQYQAARFDAEGIGKLIKSIGEVIGLDSEQITNKIETRGPELERLLAEVPPPPTTAATKPARREADVLDEIVSDLRALRADFEAAFRGGTTIAPSGRVASAMRAAGVMPTIKTGPLPSLDLANAAEDLVRQANYNYFGGEPLIRVVNVTDNTIMLSFPSGVGDDTVTDIAVWIGGLLPHGTRVFSTRDHPTSRDPKTKGAPPEKDPPPWEPTSPRED